MPCFWKLQDGSGVYKPPKIAPASMTTRDERNALRKEQQLLRQSRESAYVRELMNDLEGKPEEVSRELFVTNFICQ